MTSLVQGHTPSRSPSNHPCIHGPHLSSEERSRYSQPTNPSCLSFPALRYPRGLSLGLYFTKAVGITLDTSAGLTVLVPLSPQRPPGARAWTCQGHFIRLHQPRRCHLILSLGYFTSVFDIASDPPGAHISPSLNAYTRLITHSAPLHLPLASPCCKKLKSQTGPVRENVGCLFNWFGTVWFSLEQFESVWFSLVSVWPNCNQFGFQFGKNGLKPNQTKLSQHRRIGIGHVGNI
ncbi:hypothetical protein EDB83DRAFT_2318756 [Lactarius deliciosus]|nr:hypothetical protein EDB83DRAFT_2318756 [Lactarius deliciosus]